jgi:hypothetical protein
VEGIQGCLDAYRFAVVNTQLYGPTNFAPTIREFVHKCKQFPRDGSKYQAITKSIKFIKIIMFECLNSGSSDPNGRDHHGHAKNHGGHHRSIPSAHLNYKFAIIFFFTFLDLKN